MVGCLGRLLFSPLSLTPSAPWLSGQTQAFEEDTKTTSLWASMTKFEDPWQMRNPEALFLPSLCLLWLSRFAGPVLLRCHRASCPPGVLRFRTPLILAKITSPVVIGSSVTVCFRRLLFIRPPRNEKRETRNEERGTTTRAAAVKSFGSRLQPADLDSKTPFAYSSSTRCI